METLQPYLTQSQLYKRPSWTRSLVERFLGEPDKVIATRGLTSRANLYLSERVIGIEANSDFCSARDKLGKQCRAARARHFDSSIQLRGSVSGIVLEPEVLSQKALLCAAVNDFNAWCRKTGKNEFAHPKLARHLLCRLCVSYLMRTSVSLQSVIDSFYSKVGATDAIHTAEAKMLKAIAEQYSFLADECKARLTGGTLRYPVQANKSCGDGLRVTVRPFAAGY